MEFFDGRKIQKEILEKVKKRLNTVGYKPRLAVIWVGDDLISARYVAIKKRIAENLGINFDIYKYQSDVSQEELIEKIQELNLGKNVDGIMIQLPLLVGLSRSEIIAAVSKEKDADGLRACAGLDCEIRPPVIRAIFLALREAKIDLSSSKVAVIGKGFLVV